jgi:glucose/mannose transport system substrate-binding protein
MGRWRHRRRRRHGAADHDVSRITGGDPMAATQFNHGRQAEELVEAGLMLDLTELAEKPKAGATSSIRCPCSTAARSMGAIYCVPVNIHSWQWLWLSAPPMKRPAWMCPTNWDEFVAAAPRCEEAGLIPLAMGQQPWQSNRRLRRDTDGRHRRR